MRTTSLLAGVALSLALSSNPAHAQTKTPNTGSGGDEYASDGGPEARWWNKKGQQYPKCEGPAKQGATLTGEIKAEADKEPENIEEVNKLGKQREEVKHELQTCIAQNYGGVTLKGGVNESTQADPAGDGPYGDGSGTPGNGTPGTGKTTPPPKKQPPLSGGTQKGGGSGGTPGHSNTPPASTGHGNSGPHSGPPLYTGTVTLTWKEVGHTKNNVPYRRDGTDTIRLKIWDQTDPNVPLDDNGSLSGVRGTFANGSFTITRLWWRDTSISRKDITLSPSQKVRLTKQR